MSTYSAPTLPKVISGKRRWWFSYLLANGITQAVLAVGMALLVQHSFDTLIHPTGAVDHQAMLFMAAGLLAIVFANAGLRWRGHVDAEQLGQSYVHAVRLRLFRHVINIGADGAKQMGKGSVMLRFVGDLSALRQWVGQGLARLLVSGVCIALTIPGLIFIEPLIGISVLVAALVTAGLAIIIGPHLRQATRELRRQRGRLATPLNDRLSKIGVIETFGQEQRERKRFKKLSRNVRHTSVARARTISLLRVISEAGASLAGLCALFAGATLVNLGHTTPGTVVAAMVVAGLLAPRLQELGRVYEYWNGALIARQKQQQLLDLEPIGRPSDRKQRRLLLKAGTGQLVLENLSWEGVIKSLNITIPAGQKVVVTGSNGAGKSTLLRLIANLLEPSAGRILLDGQDISHCRWSKVRQTFAMVSPELPLLRASIRYNLTYGAQNITEQDIEQVINSCGLAPLIARLDQGIMTRVSENGEGLSTGERARIALARALLVKPCVLLLDEAEANLDANARRLLDEVILHFPGTVIMISHSLPIIRQADLVLHFEQGQLVSQGAPETILVPHSSLMNLFSPDLQLVPANEHEPLVPHTIFNKAL
ncbi:MAG: ABC transporter ATP-binding protein [Thiolinea sp.]